MSEDRDRLRSLVGQGAALWAGPDGVTVSPRRWIALSGAPSADYNVAVCHGMDASPEIEASLREIGEVGAPAVIMLAGAALADAQLLADAGWVCVGAVPLMALELQSLPNRAHADARRLAPQDLPDARALVAEVFGLTPELASVALPESVVTAPDQWLWGIRGGSGELLSCITLVLVGDAVVGWSLCASRVRGRGYGRLIFASALAEAAAAGQRLALHYSSYVGAPVYRVMGFSEIERWQMWSRPRWVLRR
ncbi:MAG: hypothetical protein ABSC56_01795 [Solirubrobacteraceae bacterium]|jgi:GNAT superfamily N-acetyltransferase